MSLVARKQEVIKFLSNMINLPLLPNYFVTGDILLTNDSLSLTGLLLLTRISETVVNNRD